MAAKRQPTIAAGAVIERSLVVRWARRRLKQLGPQPVTPFDGGQIYALGELLTWLKKQPTRTKRKGGIGR